MTKQSHDHNFKNLFLDFPKETLEWFFPQAEQNWGQVRKVEFIRQEPQKRKLSDPNFALARLSRFSQAKFFIEIVIHNNIN